jgi:4-carboxymuconolactone decarboxylase
MCSRRRRTSVLAATVLVAGLAAGAQDRMPPLSTAELTEQQTQALAEFVAARGQPTGPWIALLRSPELMTRTRGLSDYLRFESILPGYLREFVILMTARQWGQNYEWHVHYPLAIDEGFSPDAARAIAEGDATYERAVERFGEQGVVETVSLIGYYTMISMLLNTSRAPLPPGATPALAPFPY